MSAELTAKLSGLRARHDELSHELAETGAQVERAREGLIEGRGDAAAMVKCQSRRTALAEAVSALETHIEAAQSELETAERADARAASIARIGEVAAKGNEHFSEVLRIRSEASAALIPYIEKMILEFEALCQCRREFVKEGEKASSGFARTRDYARAKHPEELARGDELIDELEGEGIDLSAVIVPFGNEAGYSIADRALPFGFPWPAALPFGDLVLEGFSRVLKDRSK